MGAFYFYRQCKPIGVKAQPFNAPYFTGLTLEEAVAKAEREFESPYGK